MFKTKLLPLILLLLVIKTAHCQTVAWRCSTADAPWADKGVLTPTVPDNSTQPDILVNGAAASQTIEGWGGCFNELGWDALSTLSPGARDTVIRALFDPATGCRFNICRMPIGSSDFAMGYYSLDDTPGDYAMKDFSIARDKQRLIPYIKAAMTVQPKLKVWGSPWSPPSWMTTNGKYTGGSMTQTPQNLTAYALYLEKAVRAYRKEGLDFYAVHVQNEPVYNNNVYPQCKWTGEELRDFIKTYVGPTFRRDRVPASLWLGTLPTGDWDHYPAVILSDPAARTYLHGVGYQWGGRDILPRTHAAYPDLNLMETEMECGDGTNTWAYGEHTFDLMRIYLDGGVRSFMQWNMVLDQTGKSSWGWAQNAMITIDRNTKAVTYNPQFYAVKHFSGFVAPGATRVSAEGSYGDKVAFPNPNGDLVLVVKNASGQTLSVSIDLDGQEIRPSLPAHSFNTFLMRAKHAP